MPKTQMQVETVLLDLHPRSEQTGVPSPSYGDVADRVRSRQRHRTGAASALTTLIT